MNRFGVLSGLALAVFFQISPADAGGRKAAVPAKAAGPAQEHKLSEWRIGGVLFGEKLKDSDLKGKVVVIENWGVNCPPCVASLPHLAELDKKFRDKGLRIIGAESQGSSKEAIKPLLERAKVEYTITAGASGPLASNTIPHSYIFDVEGVLVYNGYPAGPGFENTIKEALKKAKGGAVADEKPAAAAAAPAVASAPLIPARAWTNSDGREIRAAVKSVDANTVTFLMPNGKDAVYPMDKLSVESRNLITLLGQAKQ